MPDSRGRALKGEPGFKPRPNQTDYRPREGDRGFKPRPNEERSWQRPLGARVGKGPAKKLATYIAVHQAWERQVEADGMSRNTRHAKQQQSEDDIVQHHATANKNAKLILDSDRTAARALEEGTGELRVASASGSAQSTGVWTQKDPAKCVTFVVDHHEEDVIASGWKIAVFRISKNEQRDKGRPWTFNDQPQYYPCNMDFYMSSSNIAVDSSMMTVVDVRYMFNEDGSSLLPQYKHI